MTIQYGIAPCVILGLVVEKEGHENAKFFYISLPISLLHDTMSPSSLAVVRQSLELMPLLGTSAVSLGGRSHT